MCDRWVNLRCLLMEDFFLLSAIEILSNVTDSIKMDNTAQITRASLVNMDETALSGRDLADKKGTDDFLPGMYVVETILEKLGVLAEVSVICLSFDLLNVVISVNKRFAYRQDRDLHQFRLSYMPVTVKWKRGKCAITVFRDTIDCWYLFGVCCNSCGQRGHHTICLCR